MISKQKKSGVSQTQFCRDNGLAPNTFCSWKKTIHKLNLERAAAKRAENQKSEGNSTSTNGSFVPLIVPPLEPRPRSEQKMIAEVRIGRAVVSVFSSADLASLQALMNCVIHRDPFNVECADEPPYTAAFEMD